MAEAIGVASGITALLITTIHGAVILRDTIKSYEGHQKVVRDFLTELATVIQVLNNLNETMTTRREKDFSALEVPLQQANMICDALQKELQKCLSRSSDSRTSFRDWARLKYKDEDIDGLRRLLAEYKMTIDIALADANLRGTAATAEKIDACTDLLNSTRADLLDHLERIDEKVERLIETRKEGPDEGISELRSIEEERLTTKKCLEICARLSDYIRQVKLTADHNPGPELRLGQSDLPYKMVKEGFQGCVESLSRATTNLEDHHKKLFDRLVEKSKTTLLTEQDCAVLAGLRDECATTQHSLNIWSMAQSNLSREISIIENYAEGKGVQIMASTGERILYGRNHGIGTIGQVGGHVSNDTIQQSLRVMEGIFGAASGQSGSSQPEETQKINNVTPDV